MHDASRTPERIARMKQVLSLRQKDLTLVLANIHDPHNVSAIYRSCDAFGVERVHLYYTHAAFPKLGAKSSASARKWVQTERHTTAEEVQTALRKQGITQILATSCTENARSMLDYDYTRATAILMGNEHAGLDSELASFADGEVYIPMYGMIQSFNVSVAAAIVLAEASRQRQHAGMYSSPRYTSEEYTQLLEEWLQK